MLPPSPPMQETTNGRKDGFLPINGLSYDSIISRRRSITSAKLRHSINPSIMYAVSSETPKGHVIGRYEQRISSTIFNTCEEDYHAFAVGAIDFSSYHFAGAPRNASSAQLAVSNIDDESSLQNIVLSPAPPINNRLGLTSSLMFQEWNAVSCQL